MWTHSLYTSPRNARGLFAENRFDNSAATPYRWATPRDVRVERNAGRSIGFPVEDSGYGGRCAVPVAIDTAGNVDQTVVPLCNRFEEIDGKCIDLDGFHDGEIRGNDASTAARRSGTASAITGS